jgi:hypothetical protein
MKGQPNATWTDLKQLGWALLLLYAFIAVAAALSRSYCGGRTAFWVAIGLAAFVTAALALVTGASLAISYAAQGLSRVRPNRGVRPGDSKGRRVDRGPELGSASRGEEPR